MKHYEFVDQEPKEFEGRYLRRIRCTRPIFGVRVGDLGGWIEHEGNLQDEAWVDRHAMVFGEAFLSDNASAMDYAIVRDQACVTGKAVVRDNVILRDRSRVSDAAVVRGKATMLHSSQACQYAHIHSNAVLRNDVSINGQAKIGQDALIADDKDYCVFSGFNKWGRSLTAYRTKDKGVRLDSHFFGGPLYVFEDWIKDDHAKQEIREYLAIIEVIKIHFNIK